METDLSDIVLWRAGDRQAFERLVRRYQQPVITVAYRMLGDWEDAREAAQDTFVKVFQSVNGFDLSRKISTWLYRILVNTCIDYRRRQNVATESIGITPLGLFEQADHAPDRDLELSEYRELLDRALQQLSPRHRAVITFRDIQELSCHEISEIMQCSEATVRVHLFHARRALKKTLSPFLDSIT